MQQNGLHTLEMDWRLDLNDVLKCGLHDVLPDGHQALSGFAAGQMGWNVAWMLSQTENIHSKMDTAKHATASKQQPL